MKYSKKLIALLSSLIFLGTAFSCGQSAESSLFEEELLISASNDDTENDSSVHSSDTDVTTASTEKKNNEKSTTTAKSADGVKTETTTKSESTASSGKNQGNSSVSSDSDTNSSSGEVSSSSPSGGSQSQQSSGKSSSGNQSQSSDPSSSQTNQQSGGSPSSSSSSGNSGTSGQPVTEAPTEKEAYTAKVTLGNNPSYSGSNVTSDGSRIVITAGGDYLISGAVSDGQIEINTTEKVKVYLNGVSISNSSGPAIQVTDAKRFTLVLMEGTTSNLSDGGNDKINDGVIFTNDTIEIKGKGTLNINSGNAHGIASDDDVIIENGIINISSIKSGIYAHDDITINGGDLNIKGGTNGIKSKGTININGGYSVISGGTKEEKSSVYAAGTLNYTGGYLFAAGNMVTAPSQSATPFVVAGFNQARTAGSSVSLFLNGSETVSFAPHNNFKCVMMLSPDISVGSSFGISVNESYYGDYSVSDTQNVFTID